MPEIVSMMRVLEYTGERKDVERALAIRMVKITETFQGVRIREALIGETMSIVSCPHNQKLWDEL